MEDNNNLMSYYYEDGRTMYQLFHRGMKVSGGHLFCPFPTQPSTGSGLSPKEEP